MSDLAAIALLVTSVVIATAGVILLVTALRDGGKW